MYIENTTYIRHDMRRWTIRAALATAIAGGIVCAGVGVGSADTATAISASATATTPAEAPQVPYAWVLTNNTDDKIYGDWKRDVDGSITEVDFPVDTPLYPHSDKVALYTHNDTIHRDYWTGHICYKGHQWNFGRWNFTTDHFSLEKGDGGTLNARFIDGGDRLMPLSDTHQGC